MVDVDLELSDALSGSVKAPMLNELFSRINKLTKIVETLKLNPNDKESRAIPPIVETSDDAQKEFRVASDLYRAVGDSNSTENTHQGEDWLCAIVCLVDSNGWPFSFTVQFVHSYF